MEAWGNEGEERDGNLKWNRSRAKERFLWKRGDTFAKVNMFANTRQICSRENIYRKVHFGKEQGVFFFPLCGHGNKRKLQRR